MTVADTSTRIAIVDPCEVIAAGLTRVLTRCPTRDFEVVPPEDPDARVDILLYNVDQYRDRSPGPGSHRLLRQSGTTIIATYRDWPASGVEPAQRCGAHGAVSMRLPAEELIAQITHIHRARSGAGEPGPSEHASCPEVPLAGLTARESQVLGLIGTGLTNKEIADRLYLSLNTVKTYVRGAYRKIAVEHRSQAVAWVIRQGLTPPAPTVGSRYDVAAG